MRNFHISSLVILGVVLILVCARLPQQPDEDNPMDRNSPDYIPPQVQITTDLPDTINSDSITISWAGNEHIEKTSYYLAGFDSEWSAWDTTENHQYLFLDEEAYWFYVKGIYANGDSAIDSVYFTINAISGPAVILYPQLSYATADDTIQVQVTLENVTNLVAGKIIMSFPKQSLTIAAIQKGSLYALGNYNNLFISIASDSSITIETGIACGDLSGFTGTGVLAIIHVTNMETNTSITVNQTTCDLKDANQQDIVLSTSRGTIFK